MDESSMNQFNRVSATLPEGGVLPFCPFDAMHNCRGLLFAPIGVGHLP